MNDNNGFGTAVFGSVAFSLMAVLFYMGFQSDAKNDAIRLTETTKLWNDWTAYRDANCRVTEKMFGLSETSGKFHQNDNATVYDCGGVKYVIADSIENAAKNQSLQVWQIPKIEKK